MKIVRFKNGEYAVRKGFWPFYTYVDLYSGTRCWSHSSPYFPHCLTYDKEKAMRVYNLRTDKGTPIGEDEYD